MEWLPIAVIAVFALIAALYLTVKRAVKDALKEYTEVLYDQALLVQGLPIEDPALYARKVADLMVKAANK